MLIPNHLLGVFINPVGLDSHPAFPFGRRLLIFLTEVLHIQFFELTDLQKSLHQFIKVSCTGISNVYYTCVC